jgi:hypothetical protein
VRGGGDPHAVTIPLKERYTQDIFERRTRRLTADCCVPIILAARRKLRHSATSIPCVIETRSTSGRPGLPLDRLSIVAASRTENAELKHRGSKNSVVSTITI